MYYWDDVRALLNGSSGCIVVLAPDSKRAVEVAVAEYAEKYRFALDSEPYRTVAALRAQLEAKPPEEISYPHALLFDGWPG